LADWGLPKMGDFSAHNELVTRTLDEIYGPAGEIVQSGIYPT
jgi:hypothetical protein